MQEISLSYLVVVQYFLFNLETYYPAPQATSYFCKPRGLCRDPAPCCWEEAGLLGAAAGPVSLTAVVTYK